MKPLAPGQPAPWFTAAVLGGNPRYVFSSVGGRPIVLLFHGSAAWEKSSAALDLLEGYRDLFDDASACFFGVSVDPLDSRSGRIAAGGAGVRWFLDYDYVISELYGMVSERDGQKLYSPRWLLLDPMLRVVQSSPIDAGEQVFQALKALLAAGDEVTAAPVLTAPRIFEPALCRRLIEQYENGNTFQSGFMRDENGMTVLKLDPAFKRRSDFIIEDRSLCDQIANRLLDNLAPQILRAFQFRPTRIERWLVACYEEQDQGFFGPHRDNTNLGTAHRKFACTINLNADGYEGGDLRFPEYGPRLYRAPTGGAVVFSCSLLHEVRPVTRGRRYAFLPFFYDEEAAQLREKNSAHVDPELGAYRAGGASD
jgi:predicted 2-oxoglutarate/Fe(II)-dependent dioxygenase YbiX/peroxiredoxin